MARRTLEQITEELQAAIAAGQIWNVDYKDLAYDAANAFEYEVKNLGALLWLPSPHRGDEIAPDNWSAQAADEKRRLPYSILHLPGYLKRCQRVRDDWPFFNRRIDVAEKWAPVAALLLQARPLIVKGRKPIAPEDRPVRSDNECSCCGRQIELVKRASDGADVIAHHGYQRPGHGWQTESCPGARFMAYHTEEGRDRLAWWVSELADFVARAAKCVDKLKAGPAKLRQEMPKLDDKGNPVLERIERRTGWGTKTTMRPVLEWVDITPEHPEWEKRLALEIAKAESEHARRLSYFKQCEKRLKDWTPRL